MQIQFERERSMEKELADMGLKICGFYLCMRGSDNDKRATMSLTRCVAENTEMIDLCSADILISFLSPEI